MAVTTVNGQRQAAKASFFYRPEVRQVIYQIILIAAVVFFVWEIASNVAENLRRKNIASGFGFWNRTAGFDISQTLIEYSNTSTYGHAFWVGLCNTLLVAGLGIVFATIVGFVIGIARLSSNWLVARLATVYVEVIRNLPLLLQLMFWYFAVLKNLPGPRQSLALPAGASLNVRGLYLPAPVPRGGFRRSSACLLWSASWPRSPCMFGRDAGRWRPASASRCSGPSLGADLRPAAASSTCCPACRCPSNTPSSRASTSRAAW